MAVKPSLQRLALLTGEAVLDKLAGTRAFVFGVGGVGSWCAEALVRSGIGELVIVDSDSVCVTNINRQLQATALNIGTPKVHALRDRLLEIAPDCRISAIQEIFSAQTALTFDIQIGDYVIDAIDSLGCKLDLIEYAHERGAHFFSAMGAACKLDPTRLKVADIWKSEGCPLARLVRNGLRKRGFKGHFPVVFSTEQIPRITGIHTPCGSNRCMCPVSAENGGINHEWCSSKKVINGSIVTVTACAGMILASLVIRDVYGHADPVQQELSQSCVRKEKGQR